MTPHQTNMINLSLFRLGHDRARLGGWVLDQLRRLDPALHALFLADIEANGADWSFAVGIVARALDKQAPLADALHELGSHYGQCGAEPALVALIEQALLRALGAALGRSFTNDYRAAWTAACRIVADAMTAPVVLRAAA